MFLIRKYLSIKLLSRYYIFIFWKSCSLLASNSSKDIIHCQPYNGDNIMFYQTLLDKQRSR